MSSHEAAAATRSSLHADLVRLGVRPNDLIMVHAGVRSIGRVVGGVNVIIQALFDAIAPEGTAAAYVDFEPFYQTGDPEIPIFDKRTARAAGDHGILHEALRTWPAALRSDHPDAGVVAIGPQAAWLTGNHPFQYGYGEGTPFERIIEQHGKVLLLGAPLDTITLLHYAEHKAAIPNKRIVQYRRLMPGNHGPEWIDFEEFDTGDPVHEKLPVNAFEQIATAYLNQGSGNQGKVGNATSYLFDAAALVTFGIHWIESLVNERPPRA